MESLNRSDQSDFFQDKELLEAVMAKTEESSRLNESGGSRLSAILPLRTGGNLSRPSSFVSKRSINLSQEKISEQDKSEFERIDYSIMNLVHSYKHVLSLFCVCALLLTLISVQTVISIPAHGSSGVNQGHKTLITNNVTYQMVTEVATALCTFVIVLNITCFLVCLLQCLVIIKLLKFQQGEERALKYLRDCSSSRFIAVTGQFVSIPVFLVATTLLLVLKFSSAAAITAIVIVTLGCIFLVLSLIQNSYHWLEEKTRALEGLPVFDPPSLRNGIKLSATGQELSTLV